MLSVSGVVGVLGKKRGTLPGHGQLSYAVGDTGGVLQLSSCLTKVKEKREGIGVENWRSCMLLRSIC